MPEPVWLDLQPDPVLAFLHEPASDGRRETAVLICPPFGWEEMCSYRARRRWAEAFAAAGFPAARLDLPGSGDSGGAPGDAGRVQAWTTAIAAAAAWLRARSGRRRVAAIGVGLGGMLAYRAAAQSSAIDDLVLWSVAARGRQAVRELRAHASVVAARHPADGRSDEAQPEGDPGLIGFLLDPATAAELEALDLSAIPLPRAEDRRVLMIGRDGLHPDRRLAEALGQAGVELTTARTNDFDKLVAHPQDAQMPAETIECTVRWLAAAASASAAGAGSPAPAAPAPGARPRAVIGNVVERPVILDLPGGRGFAMVTEPVGDHREPLCAVLLNGGALRHTGPNRNWVEISRRWAARGVSTVRVDLLGIGDSDGDERRLVDNPALYAPARDAETLAVLDGLAAHGLPDRFVVAGLCSGAYWALHAAVADTRVLAALMINLYAFQWSEELVAARAGSEVLRALRDRGWRRLMRRDVSAERVRAAVSSVRSGARGSSRFAVEDGQRGRIEADLDRLRDRGTEALLLFSHGEPLYEQLDRQNLLGQSARWPNLTVERIPSGDHMFRALWLQHGVHASLDRGLERVLSGSGVAESGAR